MEKEKIVINIPESQGTSEIIFREGIAPKQLDPKPPIKIDITGTIGSVAEFLTKRLPAEQFDQTSCHILVNREDVSITLIINEHLEYTRGTVVGKLSYNPKFLEFGINSGKTWTPTALGMFIKMNRALFADRKTNMDLVTTLMNFTATVNQKIDRAVAENGSRNDNFAQVVNSNLPSSFFIQMPIFKGMPSETIEVESFAQVNGRDVAFMLISPEALATLEELRDKVIDRELSKIREIAPDIVIIEV